MNQMIQSTGKKTLGRELLIALPVFAILFLAPLFAGTYHTRLLTKFILFGMFAMSLDLIWGYAGILSFGHAAYFGLGAYAVTLILSHVKIAGDDTRGARLRGAPRDRRPVHELLPDLRQGERRLFLDHHPRRHPDHGAALGGLVHGHGRPGRLLPGPPFTLFGYQLDADSNTGLMIYFYIVAVVAALVFAGLYLLSKSRYGLILQAMKSDPQRTQFMGINIATARTIVFTLSCGIAGLAGGLMGPLEDFISPSLFSLLLSTQVMIWVAVGGRNTLIGPFFGAILLGYLQAFLSGIIVEAWYLVIGIILVVVVMFWPDGLARRAHEKESEAHMSQDAAVLLKVDRVTRAFGGFVAIDDISMEIRSGELRCIIGPNGAGKTTLFNVVSGQLRPSSGHVYFGGRDITRDSIETICNRGISRKFQTPSIFTNITVIENILVAGYGRTGSRGTSSA